MICCCVKRVRLWKLSRATEIIPLSTSNDHSCRNSFSMKKSTTTTTRVLCDQHSSTSLVSLNQHRKGRAVAKPYQLVVPISYAEIYLRTQRFSCPYSDHISEPAPHCWLFWLFLRLCKLQPDKSVRNWLEYYRHPPLFCLCVVCHLPSAAIIGNNSRHWL